MSLVSIVVHLVYLDFATRISQRFLISLQVQLQMSHALFVSHNNCRFSCKPHTIIIRIYTKYMRICWLPFAIFVLPPLKNLPLKLASRKLRKYITGMFVVSLKKPLLNMSRFLSLIILVFHLKSVPDKDRLLALFLTFFC